LYDRTRTIQAALPHLFLQLTDNIESDGIDDGPKKKIVSYEEASKQINQDPSSITAVSEIISQCRDDTATGRVECDGETEKEKRGMISLKKWNKAVHVRKTKAVGCDNTD
jgi:hypothetical protein